MHYKSFWINIQVKCINVNELSLCIKYLAFFHLAIYFKNVIAVCGCIISNTVWMSPVQDLNIRHDDPVSNSLANIGLY